MGIERVKNIHNVTLCAVSVLVLSACTTPINQAPVIDRLPTRQIEGGGAASAVSSEGTLYTVKAGDTLYSIALEFGHDWRELAKANNLTDSSKIFVGQKIRVDGFSGASASTPQTASTDDSAVEVTPIPPVGGGVKPVPPQSPVVQTPVEAPKPNLANANMGFIWPHQGEIIQGFKAGSSKGVDFSAKVGDAVSAAQAGKVVYSGSALRGYGNLIIIKHDNNLLTAYAHNKTLLVKEGEPVTKGQKIAEAGQSDAERPKLHFEVRKQGKPVDPMEYLPHR